jgi:hypothetical protein
MYITYLPRYKATKGKSSTLDALLEFAITSSENMVKGILNKVKKRACLFKFTSYIVKAKYQKNYIQNCSINFFLHD